MTRLLNTPIIGPSANTVDSSWIDMLAGLSGLYILRIPPGFCAPAPPPVAAASRTAPAIAAARVCRRIAPSSPLFTSPRRLSVEPDVLKAVAVEGAGDHDRQPLDVRLPASPAAAVEDDRARAVLGQLALDRPEQLLAPPLLGLDRLLVDHSVHFPAAVAVPVEARTAGVEQLEGPVGVRSAGLQVEADAEVLAQDLGEIDGGVDRFELAVDIDLL